jgi:hypothetical protein
VTYTLFFFLPSQILFLQVAVQCCFAATNYRYIIQQRRTVEAYLMGWGVVIPVSVYFTFWLVGFLDVQNGAMKLSCAATAWIVALRTIEAMYDTSPRAVETSVGTYCAYYTSILHFEWDEKTAKRRRVSLKEVLLKAAEVFFFANVLALSLSIFAHLNYEPFHSPVQIDQYNFNLDLLRPAHLANMYGLAILTFLSLRFGYEMTALGEQVKGYYTKPLWSNPLFTSTSPSDFWSRKWNLMIHRLLKYGAFLPARQYVGKRCAVAVTFVASGLMHEYTWALLFGGFTGLHHHHHRMVRFKVSAFFLWNGALMTLERPLAKYFQWTHHLPLPVRSTLVLLLSLPVAHWHCGDWVKGDLFEHVAMGLWQIRKIAE